MSYCDPRPTCVFDVETFYGYWAIAFRCVDSGRTRLIETYAGKDLDIRGIATVLTKWRVISFNGHHYDIPMIMLALTGADTEELKAASDEIINTTIQPWQFLENRGLRVKEAIDHIDLFSVAPGMASLKIYGGRIHTKRMQSLPYHHDTVIEEDYQREVIRNYLINDLNNTVDLYRELLPRVELRALMSDRYGVDLRSKSDPQLAEAVLKHDIEELTGKRLWRPNESPTGVAFKYRTPAFVKFETLDCREMLAKVESAWFKLNEYTGALVLPPEITSVVIDGDTYKMGIGGLHSTEKKRSFIADEETVLLDRDVTSYYPAIILALGLYPPHIGQLFLQIFRGIVEERIAAKRAGDKEKAEMFKIVVNGCFGKFGNYWSVVYAPDLLIQTTVTGQLCLLMLIERLALAGFKVISANTDGVTTRVARGRRDEFKAVIEEWEWDTSFDTEEVEYRAVHQRDVNNYVAVKLDGSNKSKGFFAIGGLQKNPNNAIAIEAATAFLTDGKPVAATVRACQDIRKFLTVRTVNKGGAVKNGVPIGKAIRFYHGELQPTAIHYAQDNAMVPNTTGAVPLMELPDGPMPVDVDFDYYIREAEAMIEDVGVPARDPALVGRRGLMLARLPDQKNIHQVALPAGRALCGRFRTTLRDRWVEYQTKPLAHRLCASCRREAEL